MDTLYIMRYASMWRLNFRKIQPTKIYPAGNSWEVFLQVDEDEPLFLSLISDLFPGIQLDNATYEDLQVAIQHQVEEAKMVNHPSWNLKIVQVSVCETQLF